MKTMLVPIAVTVVISAFVGLCTLNSPLGFTGGFGLSLVLHFVLGGIFNTYLQYRSQKEFEQIANDRITEINKQTMKLACPCERNIEQTVPLFFNRQNYYNCAMCDKLINCKVSVSTILPTQILDLDASHSELVQKMQQKVIENAPNE